MAEQKLTKNERREQAREQARLAREAEKKREKRNRLLLQGGVVVGVIAVLAIVALVLTQSMKPAGPGPENMASGGVTFGTDLKVEPTPALAEGAEREARDVDWTQSPIDVTVYVDYMCPACGNFERIYGEMLETYAGSGDITLTVYPINFLDGQSAGTKYSSRAGNIMACVVEQQPDHAFALHNLLLSQGVQPSEGTGGLTDEQLVEQAEAAGADGNNELKQCVKDQRFAAFIDGNRAQVFKEILGVAEGAQLAAQTDSQGNIIELQAADQPQRLVSTPTVIVNGKQWNLPRDGELEDYILKLKAELDGTNGQNGDSDADADEEETTETE